MATTLPTIEWDVQLMLEDIADKGWSKLELANRAGVADMTVLRFLNGKSQTIPTAYKLARALGYRPRRYLISKRDRVAL
jgi:transcriptional regulator with XRE-family HTH domain